MQYIRALIVVLFFAACSSTTPEMPNGAAPATPVGTSPAVLPTAAGTGGSAQAQVPARVSDGSGAGAPGSKASAGAVAAGGTSASVASVSAGASGSVGAAGAGVAAAAAGVGGFAASAAGTAGKSTAAIGSAGTGVQGFRRSCVKAGNEVVNIGDSYSNYDVAHMPMMTFMSERARKDGALQAGDSYLDYAQFGTTLAAMPAEIPNQWERAKLKLPIKVVIMSAGGNDSLISNPQCQREDSDQDPSCQEVAANSLAAGKKLWSSMKDVGVQDVLWFWYPHLLGPGILNTQGTGKKLSDYAFAMLQSAAKEASTDSFHVWMISTLDVFEGHPEYFYAGDNLHANDVGQGKIADKVWQVMKDNCIAQAAASGCCMP